MTNGKNELLGERYAKALQLREDGLTYKAIGQQLDVGAQRARQMVFSAKRKLNSPADEWPELSVRARNCLRAKGYDTKEPV